VHKLKRRTKPLKAVNPNAKIEEDAWTPEEGITVPIADYYC
jgi:hypothetical protein